MDYTTIMASHHEDWTNAGLKDYGDFAECVTYYNCDTLGDDTEEGMWFYPDDDSLTIYGGTFGNEDAPGSDSCTWAQIYEDEDAYKRAVAELEACPEYLPSEESLNSDIEDYDYSWYESESGEYDAPTDDHIPF
jgi:hypothetical protein